jgi:hypothetical protein
MLAELLDEDTPGAGGVSGRRDRLQIRPETWLTVSGGA